jgi:hypothetical protein
MTGPGPGNTNGGGSGPLVPFADFREICDFPSENLGVSSALRVSVWGRWHNGLILGPAAGRCRAHANAPSMVVIL